MATWKDIEADVAPFREGFIATYETWKGTKLDDGTKITQAAFAQHFGISPGTFKHWVAKGRGGPSTSGQSHIRAARSALARPDVLKDPSVRRAVVESVARDPSLGVEVAKARMTRVPEKKPIARDARREEQEALIGILLRVQMDLKQFVRRVAEVKPSAALREEMEDAQKNIGVLVDFMDAYLKGGSWDEQLEHLLG